MSTTTKTGEPARRRHGSGSLVEVSPRHWSLRVYDPATRRQVYKSFVGGSREANQALANFAADVRAGKAKPIRAQKAEAKAQAQLPATPSERTLGQLLDEWLAHRQSLGLSPTTLRGYQRMAKRIQADPVASTALSVLEPFDLDALYGRLTAEGKGPRTVKLTSGGRSRACQRGGGGASWDRPGWVPGPSGGTWGPGPAVTGPSRLTRSPGLRVTPGSGSRSVWSSRTETGTQPGGQVVSPSVWPTAGEPWPMVTSTTW